MNLVLDSETPRERRKREKREGEERGRREREKREGEERGRREREKREGEERGRPKTGSPFKVQEPNLALRDGQGFGIRPLSNAGAKGAESGGNGRQIRRPFHSDCDLPRSEPD